MAQSIRLLCDRFILEKNKGGLQWLVGSHLMPNTVISLLHCLHWKDGEPDFRAESADMRTLLPKGLEIVGAVVYNVGELETVKRAAEIARTLASMFNGNDPYESSGLIVACLASGDTLSLKFYHSTSQSLVAVETVFYQENPSAYLWEHMCLLHCKLQLQVPLYATSFASHADYGSQLSAAISVLVDRLGSEGLYCLVEGSARMPRKLVISNLNECVARRSESGSKLSSSQEDLCCSELCSSNFFTSLYGLQMPLPVNLVPMVHRSLRKGKQSAPSVEYLPVNGEALLRVLNLNLAVICISHRQLLIHEAITSLLVPALIDQLLAMRDILVQEVSEHPKLCSYNFCPPGSIHPISCIYNISYGESEMSTVECRRMLHRRLGLPMDRPLLRIANALSFLQNQVAPEGKARLTNVHINMPTGSGVVGGCSSMIQGSYEYYHYLQDNMNDSGWGCAYRSLQTIVSWFKLQHYTTADVPTHEKIQETLVKIGDKEPSFKGCQNWIGAIELSFVLDELLGVSSKILNVRSGSEIPEKCRELALHFETQGTPVMIGGGVLAYTLLGVNYNDTTGDCAFLILDPHYTGGEDLRSIWAGGWCGWKKPVNSKGELFFLPNKFYNLLLPQRPNTI